MPAHLGIMSFAHLHAFSYAAGCNELDEVDLVGIWDDDTERGAQMAAALLKIEEEGSGVFLYMRQEGRGIGLVNKMKAYRLQDEGADTVEANERLGFPADLRDYGIGAQILRDLGVRRMRLMTNNPRKIVGLESYGLVIENRVPLEIEPNLTNARYLQTKKARMGHLLDHL